MYIYKGILLRLHYIRLKQFFSHFPMRSLVTFSPWLKLWIVVFCGSFFNLELLELKFVPWLVSFPNSVVKAWNSNLQDPLKVHGKGTCLEG